MKKQRKRVRLKRIQIPELPQKKFKLVESLTRRIKSYEQRLFENPRRYHDRQEKFGKENLMQTRAVALRLLKKSALDLWGKAMTKIKSEEGD